MATQEIKPGVFLFADRNPLSVQIGTVGRTANTADYSRNDAHIRLEEKILLSGITGIEQKSIVMLNQIHGDTVLDIERIPSSHAPYYAEADGMITPLENVCLVIRTADCVPVYIFDTRLSLLGAAHSGWRGCMHDITGKLVDNLIKRYGSRSTDLHAFILPSIGSNAYTVNSDVAAYFPLYTRREGDTLYLNLQGHITDSLIKRGVPSGHIFSAGYCTSRENSLFYSHRRGDRGRNLNFGYIKTPRNPDL